MLSLRKYNAKYSYLIIVLLVCCPSKNLFQFSSSNFSEGDILRGAEMARYKLTLCLKDGPSWDKALAVTFRHSACITQGRLLAIIYMAELYDLILSISVAITYSKLVPRVFFFSSMKAKKGMELSYCNDSTVTVVFIGEAWGELCVCGCR